MFSATLRQQYLQQLQTAQLDVLVIGGGITGAGIALDAQVRGMKTGLVEMQDFAAGTSSRSTKLVHGGLRYLKQLEFGLVAEVGRERRIVYENGPHVTQSEPMLLPLVKGGSLEKWSASVGLRVYEWLAGVKQSERRNMLNAAETVGREPLLRHDILEGGAYYYEYRTDDARLTLEIIKEAVHRGALAVNYAKVTGFLYEQGKVSSVQVTDQLGGQHYEMPARKVVNATGPWVDALDTQNDPATGNKLHLTKGVHLVFDQSVLPLRQAIYFDAPDKRMIFAIPRDGKTYVGTTDTSYQGDLVHPRLTTDDRDYLLHAISYMFPEVRLTAKAVESSWVGLRPLIKQPGKGPTEISRKDEIFTYESGLITIAGGKLTGYRKMAERVVNRLALQFQKEGYRTFPACTTHRVPVSGGKVGGSANFGAFVAQATARGVVAGLSETEARQLTRFYGANAEKIYERIRNVSKNASITQLPRVLLAQLQYSLEEEMTTAPTDFFIRRTGALYFNITWVRQWQEPVLAYMANYFHWDTQTTEAYRQELHQRLAEATDVELPVQSIPAVK